MPAPLKKTSLTVALLAAVFLGLLFFPVPGQSPNALPVEEARAIQARGQEHFDRILDGQNLARPFPPLALRADNPTTSSRIALGRLLFFDPILSGDNTMSCATCHHPDLGFSDGRQRSMGLGGNGIGPDRAGGVLLRRNTPSVWNAAYNHRQFWDGRAADLEEQAGGPIRDGSEMAEHPDTLVRELGAIPAYVDAFRETFDAPEPPVTFERVTYAIAAFERTLLSQNAPFDRYTRGERDALTPSQRRGLNLFRSLKTRCFECHNLPTFANPDFKVIGVPEADSTTRDTGRGELEGAGYEGAFKVPSLRNVALTAPYMHNGVFATLDDVLRFYAGGGGRGLGLEVPLQDDKIRAFALSDDERADLVAFLQALTDESAMPDIPTQVPSGLPVIPRFARPALSPASVGTPADRPAAGQIRREGRSLVVEAGARIQDAIDRAQPGDSVVVRPGTYREALAIDVSQLTLLGTEVGGERTILDGGGLLTDGIVGSGSQIEIRGFHVRNYTANGIMIDRAADVVFRDLVLENTGLYGVYPVEVVGVTVERCRVVGARDAGIYVGQSKHIVVRQNVTHGNVTGIEIENSVDARVEENDVYDNTGGILVFLLPNNPSKISHEAVIRGNRVYSNNRENVADPDAFVARVPAGTGIMVLAADNVRVTGNEVVNNRSAGIAVLGLDSVFGAGTAYDVDPFPENNLIFDNVIEGNGLSPDPRVAEAGFDGADLIWDLSGTNNSWDQSSASRLPYTLPTSEWSSLRRQANRRLWQWVALAL
jgi:parallel beta-helix repeat protein